MCTDTKGRIAEAVEQMLQTRPVCKITVQRVMEQAQMKRQSFYYHYQDIYSVLEWIVETQLCAPLQYDGAQAPGEWCLQALTLLREKQPLLRKISHALGQETMYRLTGKVIRPQLARLLPDPRGGRRNAVACAGYALSGRVLHRRQSRRSADAARRGSVYAPASGAVPDRAADLILYF